jgi:hypothetical protein
MHTEIEQLRDSAIRAATEWYGYEYRDARDAYGKAIELVDALIAAAREEGAERERMRIWMLREEPVDDPNTRLIIVPVRALMLPDSVLNQNKRLNR